jgi:hypothetical protein
MQGSFPAGALALAALVLASGRIGATAYSP